CSSDLGERLQQHQAKSVGPARKNENVGRRIDLGQRLALQRAEEYYIGIFLLHREARRGVADDHLGSLQIELKNRLEILFPRDPADADENRLRLAQIDGARTEQRGVDT